MRDPVVKVADFPQEDGGVEEDNEEEVHPAGKDDPEALLEHRGKKQDEKTEAGLEEHENIVAADLPRSGRGDGGRPRSADRPDQGIDRRSDESEKDEDADRFSQAAGRPADTAPGGGKPRRNSSAFRLLGVHEDSPAAGRRRRERIRPACLLREANPSPALPAGRPTIRPSGGRPGLLGNRSAGTPDIRPSKYGADRPFGRKA